MPLMYESVINRNVWNQMIKKNEIGPVEKDGIGVHTLKKCAERK